jgi:hypothetical protein
VERTASTIGFDGQLSQYTLPLLYTGLLELFRHASLRTSMIRAAELTPAFRHVLFGSFQTVKHQAQQSRSSRGHGSIGVQQERGSTLALYSVDPTAGTHDIKSTHT